MSGRFRVFGLSQKAVESYITKQQWELEDGQVPRMIAVKVFFFFSVIKKKASFRVLICGSATFFLKKEHSAADPRRQVYDVNFL